MFWSSVGLTLGHSSRTPLVSVKVVVDPPHSVKSTTATAAVRAGRSTSRNGAVTGGRQNGSIAFDAEHRTVTTAPVRSASRSSRARRTPIMRALRMGTRRGIRRSISIVEVRVMRWRLTTLPTVLSLLSMGSPGLAVGRVLGMARLALERACSREAM